MSDNSKVSYGWDFFNRSAECTLDALNYFGECACSTAKEIDVPLKSVHGGIFDNVLIVEKDERHLRRSDLKLKFSKDRVLFDGFGFPSFGCGFIF